MLANPFPPGFDPRSNPNHRERGRVKWVFTADDVAKATGLSVWAVQRAVRAGALVPSDLVSLAWWVTGRHLTQHARR